MDHLAKANTLTDDFAAVFSQASVPCAGELFTGVDLGTAYIVLAVVDSEGKPVAGAMQFAQVVKDGLVVDYMGAVDIVRELREKLMLSLKCDLKLAGVAYPPGTHGADRKAMSYVAEAAGFEVVAAFDEPTAANHVLGIKDGAVVDIGGGTTGIAVFEKGEVVYLADEATGGTHFSLVIAGAKRVAFLDAEKMKTDPTTHRELFPVVRPVIEKVASIIQKHIAMKSVTKVFLVGGTSCFSKIEEVIEQALEIPVVKPSNPMLVTPLGIALGVLETCGARRGNLENWQSD